jgi:methylase of polypeptide subunit release factors
MNSYPMIEWTENGEAHAVRWRSENGSPPPKRVVVADDTLTADTAYRLACEGTGLLWRGDFQNARQLLQAIARRADRPPRRKKRPDPASPVDAFNQYRQAQSQRARTLNTLLIPIDGDYAIGLRRAPDLQQACLEAYGAPDGEISVASLRELQGLIGAHEWRKKGVEIAVLGDRIHAHYGVFSPVRGEYLDLVAKAPLPAATQLAFDIGTGTGVLAALLAKRGFARVIATDLDPRALACARENIERLGYAKQVQVVEADLFPPGKASLIVCNPPWLPARPSSQLEHAIYDPESRMLKGFIAGLGAHLEPGGEGWLVLSDIAEHIGLRSRDELLAAFTAAGLKVLDKISIRPTHPKVADVDDPLHAARALELTSIWRLAPADAGKA